MKSTNRKKAFVLIMVVSVLLLLSTFAVSFTRLSAMDRHTVTSYVDSVIADMHGSAGIDLAIANLITNFENDVYYRDYLCTTVDPISTTPSGINLVDDETAAGVPIEDLQVFDTDNVNRPSYSNGIVIGTTNISGVIEDDKTYTLKVFDTDSQININSDLKFLNGILTNLSEAIKMRAFGPKAKSYEDNFNNIDSENLGNLIVVKRPDNGYQTKDAIIGIHDDANTISEDHLEALSDFITVYPLPPVGEEAIPPFFAQSTFEIPGDKESENPSFIPAVNINTTSWCVLYALCKDIEFSYTIQKISAKAGSEDESDISINNAGLSAQATITTDDAIRFANLVCNKRRNTIFKNFQEFADFIDQNKEDIFEGQNFNSLDGFLTDEGFSENQKIATKNRLKKEETDTKAEAVKANFNTTVSNTSKFSKIHKADLKYHTIGFNFFTGGHFEITCLAQNFLKNNPIVSKKYRCNTRIFEIQVLDSQEDFELQRIGDVTTNSFSAPNNLQNIKKDIIAKSSNTEGVIDPIQLNAQMNTSALDDPAPDGNYFFKADFNGSLVPNKFNDTLVDPQLVESFQFDDIENGGGFAPRKGKPKVDLAAEGFAFKSGDSPRKLVFTDHTTDLTPGGDNFVKDDRSLMFWFKMSKDWKVDDEDEFRTVFFSNNNIVKEIDTVKYVIGVQREVQMALHENNNVETTPGEAADNDENRKRRKRKGKKSKSVDSSRQLEIKFSNSFFVHEVEIKPNGTVQLKKVSDSNTLDALGINASDIGKVENVFSLPIGVSVHAEEFYHLALQWQQGIKIPAPSFLTVTGQFYDPAGIPIITEVPDTDTTDSKGAFQISNKSLPIENSENEPLRSELVNINEAEGKMFIGEPLGEKKPEMVIDDIRITNDISWINDSTFLPSRYKLGKTPSDTFFGEFQMQINVPGINKILFVVPEIIRMDNKQGLTTENNLIIDDRTKVEDRLEEEFGISPESFPNLNDILVNKETLELKVTRKNGKDEFEIKNLNNKRLFRFNFPGLSLANNQDVIFPTPDFLGTGDLATILNNYLKSRGKEVIDFSTQLDVTIPNKNISEFEAIVPENTVPGEPINITFRFQRLDENPIFQSPLLDKVTFAFVGKPQMLEYSVQGR